MDNSIFYTFSTIAQVVAGLCAIITALCTFRLQTLESELGRRVERVNSDETIDTSEFTAKECAEHHLVRRDLGLRLKKVKVIDPSGSAYDFLRMKWLMWAVSYGQRLVVITLGLSAATIVCSVSVLAMVDYSMGLIIPRLFASKGELLFFSVAMCASVIFFNVLTLVRIMRNR